MYVHLPYSGAGKQATQTRGTDMRVIRLIEASEYEREHYGLIFKSATLHSVTGKGVHNREFDHCVDVWDNTKRDRGDGTMSDPDGKVTTSALSFRLSAHPRVIGGSRDTRAQGEELAIGDTVILEFPDGMTTKPLVITARPLHDPALIPAPEPQPQPEPLTASKLLAELVGFMATHGYKGMTTLAFDMLVHATVLTRGMPLEQAEEWVSEAVQEAVADQN